MGIFLTRYENVDNINILRNVKIYYLFQWSNFLLNYLQLQYSDFIFKKTNI